jgi:hypothetical protein
VNIDKSIRIFGFTAIFISIIWGFMWLVVGSLYTFPNAEDLSVSIKPRLDSGFLISIIDTLLAYDGRYFANILHALNPLVFGWIEGYKFMPIFAVCLLIFSLSFLVKSVFREQFFFKIILLSTFLVILIIASVPSLPHMVFWMISSFVYLYPWSFLFLWVAGAVNLLKSETEVSKNLWFLFTAVFLVFSIGLNEMFLVANFFALISFTFLFSKGEKMKDFTPLLLIAGACFFLFVSSPGISHRISTFEKGDDFSYFFSLFILTINYFIYSIWSFLLGNSFVVASFFLLGFAIPKAVQKKINFNIKFYHLSILLLVLYLMTIPFYFGIGKIDYFPKRVYSSLIPGYWIIGIIVISKLVSNNMKLNSKMGKSLVSIMISVLFIFLFLFATNNFNEIRKEYKSGIFSDYKLQMNHRYEQIYGLVSSELFFKIAVVNPINNPPKTIFFEPDICENRNPDFWNVAYEEYFFINEIRLKNDTTPHFFELKFQEFKLK